MEQKYKEYFNQGNLNIQTSPQPKHLFIFRIKLIVLKQTVSLESYCIQILRKQDRTIFDLLLLLELMKLIGGFQKLMKDLDHNTQLKIMKIIIYEEFPAKTILFKKNDVGDAYYIIVNGSIVLTDQIKNQKTGEFFEKILNVLYRGDSLGEKALLENSGRSCSAVINDFTQLLRINKRDFLIILKDYFLKQAQDKVKFMDQYVPGVFDLSKAKKQQMLYYFQQKVFQKRQVIVKEGDLIDAIYFIFKGECKIQSSLFNARSSIISNGSFFGESSCIFGKPENYTIIVASREVTCLFIKKTLLVSIPMSVTYRIKQIKQIKEEHRKNYYEQVELFYEKLKPSNEMQIQIQKQKRLQEQLSKAKKFAIKQMASKMIVRDQVMTERDYAQKDALLSMRRDSIKKLELKKSNALQYSMAQIPKLSAREHRAPKKTLTSISVQSSPLKQVQQSERKLPYLKNSSSQLNISALSTAANNSFVQNFSREASSKNLIKEKRHRFKELDFVRNLSKQNSAAYFL